MLRVGTQRTLARVSSASATHTLACAAATISGRASLSLSAVARLIGKRRSVDSSGAALSLKVWSSPTVGAERSASAASGAGKFAPRCPTTGPTAGAVGSGCAGEVGEIAMAPGCDAANARGGGIEPVRPPADPEPGTSTAQTRRPSPS